MLYIDQARANAAAMQLSMAMSQAGPPGHGGQIGSASADAKVGAARALLSSAMARVGADRAMLNLMV